MRKCRNWALSLAMMAGAPAAAYADLPFKSLAQPAPRAASRNQEVASEVGAAIKASRLPYTGLNISVQKGVCTLTGQVPDPRTKAEMTRVARLVDGVDNVSNNLVVASKPEATDNPFAGTVQPAGFQAAPAERGAIERVGLNIPTTAPASGPRPQQLADEIKKSLVAEGLSGHNIRINVVEDGKATLSGVVASHEDRARFYETTKSVPGVKTVANRLTIEGEGDPALAQADAARRGQFIRTAYQDPQNPAAGQPQPPAGPMPPGPPLPAGAPGYGPGPGYGPAPGYGPGPGYGPPGGYGPPPAYGQPPAMGVPSVTDQPYVPPYAWPSYAQYPNSAAVNYPKQYSASAWPYIGPFYPYPQVPLGWRAAQLEWKDGSWALNFKPRTERWWWFLNPQNWTDE